MSSSTRTGWRRGGRWPSTWKPRSRLRPRRSDVAALVLTALVVASCGGDDDTPPLERARDLVEDDGGFGTAIESGDTFAHVAELLLEVAAACEPAAACPAVLQASAYVQAVAVEVLACTEPGVHDARRLVLDHLDEVTASPADAELQPPPLPSC